jgi:hypothetical protein
MVIMSSPSQLLADDFLTRWSSVVLSCSALAEQQRSELADWFIHLVQDQSRQEKTLSRALRFKDEFSRLIEDSATDWLRLIVNQQTFGGEQLRKTAELLRSRSVPEVQATMASLWESALGLWRINAHNFGRAGARLMAPWSDFWLLRAEEAAVEPAIGPKAGITTVTMKPAARASK